MFVRIISPDDGNSVGFELDIDYSCVSSELQRILMKGEVVAGEAKIYSEHQNAAVLEESDEYQSIRKLSVGNNVGQPASATTSMLSKRYPEIFEQSIVHVAEEDEWAESDYLKKENRVQIGEDSQKSGSSIQTLYGALNRPRTVDANLLNLVPSLRDGIERTKELHNFLVASPTGSTSSGISHAELKCYDDIFNRIVENVGQFPRRRVDSSQMRTWFFATTIMHHPFFLDKHPVLEEVEMAIEHSSGLHMFIEAEDQAEIRKVTPENNIVVNDNSSGLPILICEVDISDIRKNRAKIVLQGVVACRQWRYILPDPLKDKNMFLGLFVRHNFTVELYLFHADNAYNVRAFRRRFILTRKHEALQLARILFNYRDKLQEIAGQADKRKIQILMKIVSSRKIPPSSTPKSNARPRRIASSESDRNRTHPLLLSAQVKSLCPKDVSLQGTTHENIAAVRMLSPPFELAGFVKLSNRYELDAFEAIRKSGSPLLLNRIVLPTKVVELSGRSVAFLPYGGDPLAYSGRKQDGPSGHELEIAWDLLNIVAGLHEIHIAHLDIKPTNILWDTRSRSIRIIDFDSSEIIDPNGSRMIKGVSGTSGYVAPEAEMETDLEYDPFLADAFSCGEVIFENVMAKEMSEEESFVAELSGFLSSEDVDERWSVNKALEAWMDWLKEHGRPVYDRE